MLETEHDRIHFTNDKLRQNFIFLYIYYPASFFSVIPNNKYWSKITCICRKEKHSPQVIKFRIKLFKSETKIVFDHLVSCIFNEQMHFIAVFNIRKENNNRRNRYIYYVNKICQTLMHIKVSLGKELIFPSLLFPSVLFLLNTVSSSILFKFCKVFIV